MVARVSSLESFRRWREREDQSVEDLIHWLTTDEPSEAMVAGSAFHKALETARPGDYDTLYADGYTFHLPDGEIALPEIRELRAYKFYGPLQVTGQVDCLHGKRIDDHKTTGRVDVERYLGGYQWRLYLDIFEADVFRWNIFEISEVRAKVYQVADPQTIEVYRYPGMHADCARLAAEFHEFARDHLPTSATVEAMA